MQRLLGNLKRGLLFVMSAPAGTGKTTLMHRLADEFSCVVQSVSFTTREPRENETQGVHYNFIDKAVFSKKIHEDEFLEHAEIYGDYYGTSKKWVEEKLSSGFHVVLVIDTQGAMQLMKKTPAIFIFIKPPSLDALRKRLEKRQTESKETIDKRLAWALKEIEASSRYDYTIINQDLETAYQVLRGIFIAEEHRSKNIHNQGD